MDLNLRDGTLKFQPPNYMVIYQICDPLQVKQPRGAFLPRHELAGRIRVMATHAVRSVNIGVLTIPSLGRRNAKILASARGAFLA